MMAEEAHSCLRCVRVIDYACVTHYLGGWVGAWGDSHQHLERRVGVWYARITHWGGKEEGRKEEGMKEGRKEGRILPCLVERASFSFPNHQPWHAKIEAQLEYAHVLYTFFARLCADMYASSVLINKTSESELSRKFVNSALSVGFSLSLSLHLKVRWRLSLPTSLSRWFESFSSLCCQRKGGGGRGGGSSRVKIGLPFSILQKKGEGRKDQEILSPGSFVQK